MDWKHLLKLEFSDLNLDQEDKTILDTLAEKLQNNYPYHSVNYAGQMIKPPHILAQAAYWMSTYVNPNNHALDGGKATSELETEVIQSIASMFGWAAYLGHLTSGGTMGNLEALWVARQVNPDTIVLASTSSHYTHGRMSEVLGLPFQKIRTDIYGRMDVHDLQNQLSKAKAPPVVVVTMGTTGLGKVDPLEEILQLREQHEFRIHVDAAYGGYFGLCELPNRTAVHYNTLNQADSIVIDPHKHGLQPYGCGAVLFKNPEEGKYYKHDSPYTYFTSNALHLGEITLECSRAGSAAAALWATIQKFPLEKSGKFAARLEESLQAARGLHLTAQKMGFWSLEPELDICVFSVKGSRSGEISRLNRDFFERKANDNIHLALLKLTRENCPWNLEWETDELVVIRSVLMKPEHNSPSFWRKVLE
jgi:glutamate/tyrosine decarboxylase-like PLP-dependent enzyme